MSDRGETPWERVSIGDLRVHRAYAMSRLPGVIQGFTTRHGGVSGAPYDSLNLGLHVKDEEECVQENRRRLWSGLGFEAAQVAMAEQIHGDVVRVVTAGSLTPSPGADALVTAAPNILLALWFADCVPVYFVDPVQRVIGLAHAGWRGTAANIAAKTVHTMEREFGCRPDDCVAAVGPSIAAASYIVGREVADVFREIAPNAITSNAALDGKFHLDLHEVLFCQILAVGLRSENIAVSNEDTCRNGHDFFSYRRDGVTGRMAGYLGLHDPADSLAS